MSATAVLHQVIDTRRHKYVGVDEALAGDFASWAGQNLDRRIAGWAPHHRAVRFNGGDKVSTCGSPIVEGAEGKPASGETSRGR